ncbi:MAG: hypothetical protein JO263_01605 [Candidatus Eremiobacteraeota bacterium]|nr:hypothetical protein [Candidatus Eremiobacteraeota bacterium]
MDNYVAIVVEGNAQAFDTLHALWDLDAHDDLTVHGAVVVSRDRWGHIDVQTAHIDHPGGRTAIGVGIGLFLGALASPAGAAVGAAAGLAAGLVAEDSRGAELDQAKLEASLVIPNGAWAVLADVSEGSPQPLDSIAKAHSGRVFRRGKGDVVNEAHFSVDYGDYLYPYDYRPQGAGQPQS